MQPAIPPVPIDKLIQTGFIYRNPAGKQPFYLLPVHIHAGHIHAHLRKTRSADESYISCSDYRYVHIDISLTVFTFYP